MVMPSLTPSAAAMDFETLVPAACNRAYPDPLSWDDEQQNMQYGDPVLFEIWNQLSGSIASFPHAEACTPMADDPGQIYDWATLVLDTASNGKGNKQVTPTSISTSPGDGDSSAKPAMTPVSEPSPGAPFTEPEPKAKANIPEPPKAAARKRGPRRGRDDDEMKRHTRQRNRIAASRFRERRKGEMGELKDLAADVEAQNRTLRDEIEKLRYEVNQIKTELLRHGTCSDANIDQWIAHEAATSIYQPAAEKKDGQTRRRPGGSRRASSQTSADAAMED